MPEEDGKGLNQLFYSRKFQNGELVDVTVLDLTRSDLTQMLRAKRTTWNESQASWDFLDGFDEFGG